MRLTCPDPGPVSDTEHSVNAYDVENAWTGQKNTRKCSSTGQLVLELVLMKRPEGARLSSDRARGGSPERRHAYSQLSNHDGALRGAGRCALGPDSVPRVQASAV